MHFFLPIKKNLPDVFSSLSRKCHLKANQSVWIFSPAFSMILASFAQTAESIERSVRYVMGFIRSLEEAGVNACKQWASCVVAWCNAVLLIEWEKHKLAVRQPGSSREWLTNTVCPFLPNGQWRPTRLLYFWAHGMSCFLAPASK